MVLLKAQVKKPCKNMEKTNRFNSALTSGKNFLCLVITLLPLIYLVNFTIKYSVDVPLWDDWKIVPLLDKSYQGTLTINDFLGAPAHPHRIFFPRLIILILARLTGWNLSYQFFLNILLGVGIFIILSVQLKEVEKSTARGSTRWLFPVFAIIIFSLSQWCNWFWGWQICILLNVFSAVFGIFLLTRPKFRWLYFISTACLGIIATYSFGYGLIF